MRLLPKELGNDVGGQLEGCFTPQRLKLRTEGNEAADFILGESGCYRFRWCRCIRRLFPSQVNQAFAQGTFHILPGIHEFQKIFLFTLVWAQKLFGPGVPLGIGDGCPGGFFVSPQRTRQLVKQPVILSFPCGERETDGGFHRLNHHVP